MGDSINLIAIYAYGFQMTFHSNNFIHFYGKYQITKDDQVIVSSDASKNLDTETFHIGPFLNQKVTKVTINEPTEYRLNFANGYSLSIFDENKTHETADINGFII